MTKADDIFKANIEKIMDEGVFSEQARPKYKDGRTANSKYITGAFAEYDLAKGNFQLPLYDLFPLNQLLKNYCGFIKIKRTV